MADEDKIQSDQTQGENPPEKQPSQEKEELAQGCAPSQNTAQQPQVGSVLEEKSGADKGRSEGPQKILDVLDQEAEKPKTDRPAADPEPVAEGSPYDLPLPPGVEEMPQQEELPKDLPLERPGLDNRIEPELMISEAMRRLDKMLKEIKSADDGAGSGGAAD